MCNFTTDSKFFGNSLINFVLKFLALTLELVGEGGSLRFSGALWINGRDPVGSVYHIQTFPAGIPKKNLPGVVALPSSPRLLLFPGAFCVSGGLG